ncbi:hypothetical protein BH10BDE1_BH10BDE1_19200 [soil metagenome]
MHTVVPMSAHRIANRLAEKLIPWYREVRRPLPWRENRDPYRIWVSEVMLQQTTVTAVIPFYEKFMQRFPTLEKLALAKEESVLEYWAGLGYYSRARSLYKSAKALHELGRFPKTCIELIELPGFGPYTSRAVSSLAFGEPVGVVDGNVIRVLSRVFDLDLEWWKTKDRDFIQIEADRLANASVEMLKVDPSDLNQALMELGATICTPQSPTCMMCPWSRECLARKNDTIALRPRPKPRRESEIWLWTPELIRRRDLSLLLVKNDYAPFLKGHMIWPGQAVRLKKKPKSFHYKGGVTHHEIYVNVAASKKTASTKELRRWADVEKDWVSPNEIKTKVPSSLIRRALTVLDLDDTSKD